MIPYQHGYVDVVLVAAGVLGWHRCATRASASADDAFTPAQLDLDALPLACVRASVQLGLRRPLFSGDRVLIKRAG